MRILLIFSLSLFFSLKTNAQTATVSKSGSGKSTIAYFNYDSLLVLVPGYKESADSVKLYKEAETQKIKKHAKEYALKSHEYDSLREAFSPFVRHVKEKELQDLQQNIQNEEKDLHTIDGIKSQPFELKLTEAAKKIALAKGYTAVTDSKNASDFVLWAGPGITFVNMTTDLCAELGIKK